MRSRSGVSRFVQNFAAKPAVLMTCVQPLVSSALSTTTLGVRPSHVLKVSSRRVPSG